MLPFLSTFLRRVFSHSKIWCAILFFKVEYQRKKDTIQCFSFFVRIALISSFQKQLSLLHWDLWEELHTLLVWTKSSILQQINYKTNRNIILNLENRQAKKWQQYEGPASCTSLKRLPSTHDKADCDCSTDGLWTITSDVFMDLQCVFMDLQLKYSCCQC